MSHTTLCALRAEPLVAYLELGRELERARWEELRARGERLSAVLEILAEMRPRDVASAGDRVRLSGQAARVLLELCLAECEACAHEVGDVDFFFADLESSAPPLEGLDPGARDAWLTLLAAVDLGARRRESLPWWLVEAASCRTSSVGLLRPPEVALIGAQHAALDAWVASTLDDTLADDARAILELVRQAAAGGHWVLGWEPGT